MGLSETSLESHSTSASSDSAWRSAERVCDRDAELVVHPRSGLVEGTVRPHIVGAHAIVVAVDLRAVPLDAGFGLDLPAAELEWIAIGEAREDSPRACR